MPKNAGSHNDDSRGLPGEINADSSESSASRKIDHIAQPEFEDTPSVRNQAVSSNAPQSISDYIDTTSDHIDAILSRTLKHDHADQQHASSYSSRLSSQSQLLSSSSQSLHQQSFHPQYQQVPPHNASMPLICTSRCNGNSYNLQGISNFLTERGALHQIYGDALHFKLSDYIDGLSSIHPTNADYDGDCFVFNYGCIVSWNISIDVEKIIYDDIKSFLSEPLIEPFTDKCKFIINQSNDLSRIDMESDTIILQENRDTYLLLAFSYGLSQSVKLFQFEDSVATTIEENQRLPIELARTGQISLSRRQLSRKMGELFMTRNFVNLNSNIFDVPDFFWRRPQYEAYYEMSIKFMDLKQRIDILDDRLSVIHELYGILSNELQYTHSSRLEWIIIWLIFIEVVLTIVMSWHNI